MSLLDAIGRLSLIGSWSFVFCFDIEFYLFYSYGTSFVALLSHVSDLLTGSLEAMLRPER
jgi:hypothetical protein